MYGECRGKYLFDEKLMKLSSVSKIIYMTFNLRFYKRYSGRIRNNYWK